MRDRGKPITYYVWTISKPGRQDIKEVTTLPELQDVLRVLDLPDMAVFMKVDQRRCLTMAPTRMTKAIWTNGR